MQTSSTFWTWVVVAVVVIGGIIWYVATPAAPVTTETAPSVTITPAE